MGTRKAMRQYMLCVNEHRPSLLPKKLTEQNGQTKGDLWPLLNPPICTHHGNASKKPSPLPRPLSHTFPVWGAYCGHASRVSSPLSVKLTLCFLSNRNSWPCTVGSLDDVHLHWAFFFFFYTFKSSSRANPVLLLRKERGWAGIPLDSNSQGFN